MDHDLRKSRTEFASGFNLTLEEYLKLAQVHNSTELVIVLELMKSKKPRTGFRAFCQYKVRRWLDENKIGRPLSDTHIKQLQPRYPLNWSLPS